MSIPICGGPGGKQRGAPAELSVPQAPLGAGRWFGCLPNAGARAQRPAAPAQKSRLAQMTLVCSLRVKSSISSLSAIRAMNSPFVGFSCLL